MQINRVYVHNIHLVLPLKPVIQFVIYSYSSYSFFFQLSVMFKHNSNPSFLFLLHQVLLIIPTDLWLFFPPLSFTLYSYSYSSYSNHYWLLIIFSSLFTHNSEAFWSIEENSHNNYKSPFLPPHAGDTRRRFGEYFLWAIYTVICGWISKN